MTARILGVFRSGGTAADAIRVIRQAGLGVIEVYSPAPNHAIDEALDIRVSPIRLFTLVGGLLGCICGFAFPIYTVLEWPLNTGGRPLISIPPFVVIAFELTILFGAISGVVGFLILSGLPRLKRSAVAQPRFTNDRFGVFVACDAAQQDAVETALRDAGSEEVHHLA